MTANKPRVNLSARASLGTASSTQPGNGVLTAGAQVDATKPRPSEPWTRAYLELKIKVNDDNLRLARAQLAGWQRELCVCDPELYPLAVLAGEIKATGSTLGGLGQRQDVNPYDLALVDKFVRLAHGEVVRFEREKSMLARMLEEIMTPAGKSEA